MRSSRLIRARYQMRFDSKWISYSGFFTALVVFLLCVYYLGIQHSADCKPGEMILNMWLPVIVFAGYGILLQGVKLDAPPVYGIFGAVHCLYMIVYALSDGVGSNILAIVWYIVAAIVIVAVTFGILPGKLLVVLVFLLPFVYRLMYIAIPMIKMEHYVELIPEAAILSSLSVFAVLGFALRQKEKSTK